MEILNIVRIQRDGRVPPMPEYQTSGAAGFDLRAFLLQDIVLPPGGRALVPTGLRIALPPGYAGLVMARSGLASKHGIALANGVGLIDSDYRGELLVAVINLSGVAFTLRDGERVAQLVSVPVPQLKLVETSGLDETARGENGFGSTGVK